MTAIIGTGLLEAGLKSTFFDRYTAAMTYWQDLATRVESTKDRESYKWLGSIPKMREWGQGRLARGVRTESYDVANQKYESTLAVDRDELADDQTSQLSIRVQELAARAASHKDFLIAELLKNGGEAGFHSFDGVPFFSALHESGASGAQSNDLESKAVNPTDPTPAEFRASLKKSIAAMLALKDDVGDPTAMSATGLVAITPPSMYLTALEAINATVISATTNVLQGVARVISFPWIDAADVWYLAKTDGVVRPFIFQDREPVEFGALEEKSDSGFLREVFLYGVRARYAMTYGQWANCVRMTFDEG
jgi:phage major head subunit gpT-like protein